MRRSFLHLFIPVIGLSLSCAPTYVDDSSDSFSRRDETRLYEQSPPITLQSFNLPADDSSLSRVDITYRISYTFFVFVRNDRFTSVTDTLLYINRWPFAARAYVSVELLNSSGTSVAREIIQKEIGTVDPNRVTHHSEFLQGIFSFSLPPEEYIVVFSVEDLESNRRLTERKQKIRLRDFREGGLQVSDILLVYPLREGNEGTSTFSPINLGGDVFFGHNFDAYVEVVPSSDDVLWLTYSLHSTGGRNDTTYMTDSVEVASRKTGLLAIERTDISYSYRLVESGSRNAFGIFLPLKGDQLPQGNYELRLRLSNGSRSFDHKQQFRVRWVGVPRSLQNLDLAIDALEYIATKEEMSGLKSMFVGDRLGRFERFWAKRDPTPQTAFNEAMEEYYRRVDYAQENLGTLRSRDGYKTERGKIYILYGQPTMIDRQLSPSAPPKETWTYRNIKKRFIFVDQDRSGNFRLASTEDL
jgi:GWxTD domain-containing protein